MRANQRLRDTAKQKGVYLWEVADKFGRCDAVFSRDLRHEFPPEKMAQAMRFIDEIAATHIAEGL